MLLYLVKISFSFWNKKNWQRVLPPSIETSMDYTIMHYVLKYTRALNVCPGWLVYEVIFLIQLTHVTSVIIKNYIFLFEWFISLFSHWHSVSSFWNYSKWQKKTISLMPGCSVHNLWSKLANWSWEMVHYCHVVHYLAGPYYLVRLYHIDYVCIVLK